MAKQTNSLAHTKWLCKYHIVFTMPNHVQLHLNDGRIVKSLIE